MNADAADRRRWLVLAIAASGLFLICVDLTVLYVALPALTRDLGASNAARLWILNAYPIAVAGLLPGFGTLGDRYGHRRLFITGLLTFGIASLLAAFALSATLLVIGRALLGVGAAMMMPATLAIIRHTFTQQRERSLAIGLWSGMASCGMALGPLIAGLLLEHYWWGSVFLINVPVVIVTIGLALWWIPRRDPPGGEPWDVIGSGQILVGLVALVWAIKEIARQDFSALRLVIALLIGVTFILIYLRRQRGRSQPLIDLSLFQLPDFPAAFAAACLGTAGSVGLELVLSQYLQLVELRSPLQAAIVMLPTAIAGFIAGPLAGRALHSVRPAVLACAAFLLAAACALTLGLLSPAGGHYTLLRLVLLGGIGFGIGGTMTFASITIMNSASAERGGMAASIEEVGFELGGTLGVAVFGSLMTMTYATVLVIPESAGTLPGLVRDSLDEALMVAEVLPAGAASALRAAGRAAFTDAMRAVLIGIAVLWLATGLMILLRGRRT